jgi:hypothetical protein
MPKVTKLNCGSLSTKDLESKCFKTSDRKESLKFKIITLLNFDIISIWKSLFFVMISYVENRANVLTND